METYFTIIPEELILYFISKIKKYEEIKSLEQIVPSISLLNFEPLFLDKFPIIYNKIKEYGYPIIPWDWYDRYMDLIKLRYSINQRNMNNSRWLALNQHDFEKSKFILEWLSKIGHKFNINVYDRAGVWFEWNG